MKDQILKLAGVKSEKAFYKKFPSEAAFMKVHGKALKKAAMGASMVNEQLTQLTDFGNPTMDPNYEMPQASGGITAPAATGAAGAAKGIAGGLGGAAGYIQPAMDIISGIGMIKGQKAAVKQARIDADVSGVQAQAANTRDVPTIRQYARPEDALVQPGQVSSPYGVGTNVLGRNGLELQDGGPVGGNPTEIQNTYAPDDLYDDLGYEPLSDSDQLKQYQLGGDIGQGKFGNFMNEGGADMLSKLTAANTHAARGPSAGNQIGKGIGAAAGTAFFGPVGGMIGGALGSAVGGLFDKSGKRIDAANKISDKNRTNIVGQQFGQGLQQSYGSVMEDGGYVSNDWTPQVIANFGDHSPEDVYNFAHEGMDSLRAGGNLRSYTPPSEEAMQTYAMGGELQVHKGEAEQISTNPYLPDGGETIMFRGPSHANGGMPITYGKRNPEAPIVPNVEVEGGEPATKLKDGGTGEDNLVVFGNLQIPNQFLSEIGDPKAKGKKFKNYINDLSKIEARQNKIIEKSTNGVLDLDPKNSFDKMKLDSLHANIMGANMKLKDIAGKKQNAAAVQSAINDTAEEYGAVAEHLAQGKFVKDNSKEAKARYGADIEKAQVGIKKAFEPVNQVNRHDYGTIYNPYRATDYEEAPAPYTPGFHPAIAASAAQVGVGGARQSTGMGTSSVRTTGGGSQPQALKKVDRTTPSAINIQQKGLPKDLLKTKLQEFAPISKEEQAKMRAAIDKHYSETGTPKEKEKFPWMQAANSLIPYLRPSNEARLSDDQLLGEYYALSQNQLEPVSAQRYQPQLQSVSDISLQDQLNANQADFNALAQKVGYSPAAMSALAAQKYMANEKVLGEQFRQNQGRKDQVYNQNINTLNDAQLKNLGIFDTQYGRQAQAKSNTKAVTQAALSSMSDKILKNKLENKTLGTYENLYNYRYDNKGRAVNMNPLLDIQAMIDNATPSQLAEYNKTKKDSEKATKTKETGRNGSIVKAIKNL